MTTDTLDTTPEKNPSALSTLVAMFVEPGKAFATIERRSMIWTPLLAVILSTALVWLLYYQRVDFNWLVDKMLESVGDPVGREAARKAMSKNMMMYPTILGVAIFIPIVYALSALYFLIVAKIKNLNIGYEKWFAFAAWTSVPSLLLALLGIIQIFMTSNGQLTPNQLNPVSLNTLLLHIETGHRYASLADSISLISIWSLVLSVIGFQAWTKLSRMTSIVLVTLPWVVIYGIWFVASMMSKGA